MKGKFNITAWSSIALFMIVIFFGLGYFYTTLINKELKTESLLYLTEVGNQGTALVETKMNNQLETLKSIAQIIETNGNYDQSEMLSLIKPEADRNDYKRMGVVLLNGYALSTDGMSFDLSKRDFFLEAASGKSVISDTLYSYSDDEKLNVYATPIYQGNEIVAVLFASVKTEELKELIGISTFDNQGYSYIVKANGDAVVQSLHPNSVSVFDNIFDLLEQADFKDGDDLDTIREKMAFGESGDFTCTYNGLERYTHYQSLALNDWYMMSVVPTDAVNRQANNISFYSLVVISIGLIVISLLFISILIFQDRSKKRLEKIAYLDMITGGNNWHKFKWEASEILEKNAQKSFVLLTFDIDRFRFINEEYGNELGNKTLKLIMGILKVNMGKRETCCRVSADHFVILSEWTTQEKITQRIRNFIQMLNKEKEAIGIKEKISCHFGLYVIKDKTEDLEKIREKANMARIAAKGSDNNSWFFYSNTFREKIGIEKEIIDQMEDALENKEFEMYLQPKFDLHRNEYCGCEALVRWNRPGRGLIGPKDFIPIFEQTGFIKRLDMFMIEEACKTLKRWETAGYPEITVSVNISRKNMKKSSFISDVVRIADDYQIKKRCFEMEITESSIFEDVDRMIEVGKIFRDYGFKMSMDDFGSGYSSINLLGRLHLDTIKIDQGFFRDNPNNEQTQIVIRAMVELIKKLGMTVVAEGIETKEEVDLLREVNCDVIQGYYFGKPMPADEFEKRILKKIN